MEWNLKELGTWAGILGAITVIAGIFATLLGLSIYIIGAIPGIIQIYIGTRLLNVRRYVNEALLFNIEEPLNQISYILTNLSAYFKYEVILLLIGFVLKVVTKVL